MSRTLSLITLALAPASLLGCADQYLPVDRQDDERLVIERGKTVPGSCAVEGGDACGAQSPDGCYCDEACVQFNDCCADAADVCMPTEPEPEPEPEPSAPSCMADDGDFCGGQSADGCWCDDQCATFGDCCDDHTDVCLQPEPEPEGCAGVETYTATWDLDWDPVGVPNPHFSPPIGGTHTADLSLWAPGDLATLGIEVMAETGGTGPLADEVEDAIDDGLADQVLFGPSIPDSPAVTSQTFTVDGAFPHVTLVTMVAPSPDWFVGVSGVALCDDGAWLEGSVELTVWDAGTDSGSTFTAPDQATVPAQPVAASSAFSAPVGTLTFTRQ